jgi:hypothetical protein
VWISVPTQPASPPAQPSFIVRAFHTDSSRGYDDIGGSDDLRLAIGLAALHAENKAYRSVMVTDDSSMMWAQFNQLWAALS